MIEMTRLSVIVLIFMLVGCSTTQQVLKTKDYYKKTINLQLEKNRN